MSTDVCFGSSSDPLATSPAMLADARAGSPSAWWQLANKYSGLIFAWSRHAGVQDADAQDVLQEVLLAVHRGIQGFQHRMHARAFRGWLWTITRRKIVDVLRQKAGGTTLSPTLIQLLGDEPVLIRPDGAATGQTEPELVAFMNELDRVRQDFNPRVWQAFWRTAVDEQLASDVALELGMTPGAVRVAKHRVLQRVRSTCTPIGRR